MDYNLFRIALLIIYYYADIEFSHQQRIDIECDVNNVNRLIIDEENSDVTISKSLNEVYYELKRLI